MCRCQVAGMPAFHVAGAMWWASPGPRPLWACGQLNHEPHQLDLITLFLLNNPSCCPAPASIFWYLKPHFMWLCWLLPVPAPKSDLSRQCLIWCLSQASGTQGQIAQAAVLALALGSSPDLSFVSCLSSIFYQMLPILCLHPHIEMGILCPHLILPSYFAPTPTPAIISWANSRAILLILKETPFQHMLFSFAE